MYKYIIKRMLLVIPTLVGVTFIVFVIMSLTPGDPGSLMLGTSAPREAIEQLNEKLGYNDPFLVRYFNYLKNAVQGDFGFSYRTERPVFEEIFARLPVTFKLATASVFLAMCIGIPLGILATVKQYSLIDLLSTVTALLMAAIPGFWLGLMLLLLFSLELRILPSNGIGSIKNYIMPVITLSIATAAGLLRLTRTTMLEVIRSDYIRTARAKGAKEKTIIWKHALKNTLLPVITTVGIQFAFLLGGTIITEEIFAMPGLGSLIILSIRQKDIPQVMASVILLASFFTIIMLAVDILYAYVDPRVKGRYVKESRKKLSKRNV